MLELENTIALLEGGLKAYACTSGMAAITTLLKMFEHGDHLLVSDDLYGGTYRLLVDVYSKRYGIEFDFVDFSDLDAVKRASSGNTKGSFLETPTNPMMHVSDIAALADLAHDAGAILVVGNTFLTCYFQRPLDLGADVVVYSGTKYLCGHNDVTCGFVVIKDETLLERSFMDYMSEGGAESLITYPLVQTHGSIPAQIRDELGIGERLLRLSVGLEDADDLIRDLDQALA